MDEDFEITTPARKFQRVDILVLGLNFISEAFSTVADTFESATMLVAMHANYNVERMRFREDAMLEIETLTGEDE